MDYIVNPLSKRLIRVNGPTHKRLLRKGIVSSRVTVYHIPRGEKIGWDAKAQNKSSTSKRRELRKKCGGSCFLKPRGERPKYPVCSKSCKVSCKLSKMAMSRARLQKDPATERKALRKFMRYCKR